MHIAAAVLAATAGSAHAELRKGPYLQRLTPTGVTVMWHAEPAAPGRVVVDGPGLPEGGRAIEVPTARVARAAIEGLQPGRRYRYRVELGAQRPSGEFSTAPETGTAVPFSFIAYGDCGLSYERQRRVVARAATEVPDFMIGTGDLVNRGNRLDEWQAWFEIQQPLLRDNVIYPVLGNHDQQQRGASVEQFRTWFAAPDERAFASDVAPRYYAFSYGAARFFLLDSNVKGPLFAEETRWLAAELAAARADPRVRHLFVALHHPAYSISLHGGRRAVRERWVPLFERFGVAAVFSGHDHVYERAEVRGVRYFVTGGCGALPYELDARAAPIDRAAVRRFEAVNHYLRITVVGDQIEVAAIVGDGTAIDTVAWGDAPAPRPAVAAAGGRAPAARAAAPHAQRRDEPGGLALAGAVGALLAAMIMLRALRRDL